MTNTSIALRIFLGLSIVAAVGCSRKPKDHKAQVSYAIGAQFGKSLRNQKLDLDPRALAQGLTDGYKSDTLLLTDGEIQSAMMKMQENRQQEMKQEAEGNKVKADEFLTKNKSADGVQTTASGLQYKIIQPGTGPSPKPESIVSVNYKGTLIDGTEFDSSYKRGQPAEFPVRGVIPGWQEGLQLLKKGGKAIFYVPPELAYGDRARQQIPSNAVLIFEVELLDVKAPPPAPKDAKK